MRTIFLSIITILVAVFISLAGIYWQQQTKEKVVVVNVRELIKQQIFIEALNNHKNPDEAADKLLTKAMFCLYQIAMEKNYIILLDDKAVIGAHEITKEIEAEFANKMKQINHEQK